MQPRLLVAPLQAAQRRSTRQRLLHCAANLSHHLHLAQLPFRTTQKYGKRTFVESSFMAANREIGGFWPVQIAKAQVLKWTRTWAFACLCECCRPEQLGAIRTLSAFYLAKISSAFGEKNCISIATAWQCLKRAFDPMIMQRTCAHRQH